eukprot:31497-Pelagococcus_subviridis.AAC.9
MNSYLSYLSLPPVPSFFSDHARSFLSSSRTHASAACIVSHVKNIDACSGNARNNAVSIPRKKTSAPSALRLCIAQSAIPPYVPGGKACILDFTTSSGYVSVHCVTPAIPPARTIPAVSYSAPTAVSHARRMESYVKKYTAHCGTSRAIVAPVPVNSPLHAPCSRANVAAVRIVPRNFSGTFPVPQLDSATCCTVFTLSAGPLTNELVSPAAPPAIRPAIHGFDTNAFVSATAFPPRPPPAPAPGPGLPPPPPPPPPSRRYLNTVVFVENATALMTPYATIGAPMPRYSASGPSLRTSDEATPIADVPAFVCTRLFTVSMGCTTVRPTIPAIWPCKKKRRERRGREFRVAWWGGRAEGETADGGESLRRFFGEIARVRSAPRPRAPTPERSPCPPRAWRRARGDLLPLEPTSAGCPPTVARPLELEE